MEKQKRDGVIMLSRVLGMLFIIICHIVKYYTFIPGSEILGQFFNCGVQLFLFISGYLYGTKFINDIKGWLLKRIITIMIPSVLVSIIVIISLFFAGERTSFFSIVVYCLDCEGLYFVISSFGKVFREVSSLGPLWFTTVIMLCYLLPPLFQKIINDKDIMKLKWKLFSFITLFVALSFFLQGVISISYFIVFTVGYLCGKTLLLDKVTTRYAAVYSILFVVSIFGRLIMHRYFDNTNTYFFIVSVTHFFVGTWFVIIISYVNRLRHNIIDKLSNSILIKTLDEYSFYIYLVHGVFCMGMFNVYSLFSLPIATVIFLFFTVLSSMILKKLSSFVQKPLIEHIKKEKQ